MNASLAYRLSRAALLGLIFALACALAGCGVHPEPIDTVPVLTTVYPPSVGNDVYSSFSPSHFLE